MDLEPLAPEDSTASGAVYGYASVDPSVAALAGLHLADHDGADDPEAATTPGPSGHRRVALTAGALGLAVALGVAGVAVASGRPSSTSAANGLASTAGYATLAMADPGAAGATGSTAGASPAAGKPRPHRHGVAGTVDSVNANTITITTPRGDSLTITVGGSTAFNQAKTGPPSATVPAPNAQVMVRGTQNADGSVTATQVIELPDKAPKITPPAGTNGPATGLPFRRGNGETAGGNASPNANQPPATPATGQRRVLFGTVKTNAVNGDAGPLVITTFAATPVTVRVSGTTRVFQTVNAALSDVTKGGFVSVSGTLSADGKSMNADRVGILPTGTTGFGFGRGFPGGPGGPGLFGGAGGGLRGPGGPRGFGGGRAFGATPANVAPSTGTGVAG